ncbi:MAG: hypothetical protein HY077_15770 [Elusimicrobia bacterium]|nr:hypothetical protein [Elusimicrobiota bacterium]
MPKIQRWQVKFIVPSAGLLGIYAGAFVGMALLSGRAEHPSAFRMLLVEAALGLIGGTAAMIGTDAMIGPAARHVDWLKVPRYWIAAALCLYAADWLIEKTTSWAVPPFVSNLVLWSAGVLAVWRNEPKTTAPAEPHEGSSGAARR